MSSGVKIVKRADRQTIRTFQSAHDSSALAQGTVSVVTTVKGWITESRGRRQVAVEASCAFMRRQESNLLLCEALAARMIVSALLLTACLCGMNTRVAGQSTVRESVN